MKFLHTVIYTTLLYSFFVTAMLAMQVDSAIPGLLVDRLCANIRKRCWTSTFCTWWMIILECMLLKKVICPIDKSIFFQGDYLTIKGRRWLNLSLRQFKVDILYSNCSHITFELNWVFILNFGSFFLLLRLQNIFSF